MKDAQSSLKNYLNFYNNEIKIREWVDYPPFSDIIQIIVRGESEEATEKGCNNVYLWLKEVLSDELFSCILKPQPTKMNKMKNTYRYNILIKAIKGSKNKYLSVINELKKSVSLDKKYEFKISVDVNPYSFM